MRSRTAHQSARLSKSASPPACLRDWSTRLIPWQEEVASPVLADSTANLRRCHADCVTCVVAVRNDVAGLVISPGLEQERGSCKYRKSCPHSCATRRSGKRLHRTALCGGRAVAATSGADGTWQLTGGVRGDRCRTATAVVADDCCFRAGKSGGRSQDQSHRLCSNEARCGRLHRRQRGIDGTEYDSRDSDQLNRGDT